MGFVSDTLDTRMYEGIMDEWELQNMPEVKPIDSFSNETRIDAYAPLSTTRFNLKLCLSNIEESMGKIPDTTQCDKLASIHDQLSDLLPYLKSVEREIWRCADNA